MTKSPHLLSFDEALAVARRIQATPDADLRRATTGLSFSAIASLAVLAVKLDEIATAATAVCPEPDHAAFTLTADDAFRAGYLAGLLRAAGYLPLPETTAQEPNHGEG